MKNYTKSLLIAPLALLASSQASAYICTGAGNVDGVGNFDDTTCDADEISAAIGMALDPTLLAKDDEPFLAGPGPGGSIAFGVLEVTQAGGVSQDTVIFSYSGVTPQIIIEKGGGWYSVYDWSSQITDEGAGLYSFVRDFSNFAVGCNAQTVNCTSDTSHVDARGVVPIPAAIWLFGSGLLGLIGVARRKARV